MGKVRSMRDFIYELQQLRKNEHNQEEIMQYLRHVCQTHSLKYSTDTYTNLFPDKYLIQKIFVARIIISSKEKKTCLSQECNGLILDAITWLPLVIPPRGINKYPSMAKVNNFLKQNLYDIIQIKDGTVLTAYRWKHPKEGNIWCLASANGYDVSNYKRMGNKTYAELVYELLQFSCRQDGTLIVQKVDRCRLNFEGSLPNTCYTFGLTHPNIHPLAEYSDIWFIQRVVLDDMNTIYREYDENFPIFPQKYINLKHQIITVNDIKLLNNIKSRKNNLGYILLSKNVTLTGNCSTVLFGSQLYFNNNKLMYTDPHYSYNINAENRLEYNTLKAYLTYTDRMIFYNLYYNIASTRFRCYENFISNLLRTMIFMFTTQQYYKNYNSNSIHFIAQNILEEIIYYEGDQFNINNISNIFEDYIILPKYTLIYMDALNYMKAK